MTSSTFKNKLGKLITKAESEIDELREKISLGKMNGAELFEEMKEDLRDSFKTISKNINELAEEITSSVKGNIEELQLQLSLGKAEALDVYEEQKKKINSVIHDLEENIRDNRSQLPYELRLKIQNELEKFRLKMEVLQIRYELGRLDLKDSIESKREKFRKEFENLKLKLNEDPPDSLEAYGKDLHSAYDSLRKSLQES